MAKTEILGSCEAAFDAIRVGKSNGMNGQKASQKPSQSEYPILDRGRARLLNFGLGDYEQVLEVQEGLRRERKAGTACDTWLVGEHPVVITQGVRGVPQDVLPGAGSVGKAAVVQIDRGGMTTLHSPGQLIIYPIVKTKGGSLAAGKLARALLDAMRRWVSDRFGVDTEIPSGRPGLFFGGKKLLSIGISVREGISMHGVAINLCNDLSLWDRIVACGEAGTTPITLSEILGTKVEPAGQIDSLADWLEKTWGYEAVQMEYVEIIANESNTVNKE